MPILESSIYMECSGKSKNPDEESKRRRKTAIIYINGNPTLLFVPQYNADKQAIVELEFSEENVENPEVRKVKLRGYCT